ncbi:MAG: hypothetical protein QOJ19_3903 [Acidimicrobiia bacterium]|jgi:beta-lactamase superfamily II metal-dependent hydrolase|nr:hypothetical protein [Acidimicrobiia bacterium]
MRIDMLPAGHGDCLVVQCTDDGGTIRLLIDGGTTGTAPRLRSFVEANWSADDRDFDLAVVTHVDADHIGGALPFFDAPPEGFTARDFWFNGRQHLITERGAAQGERLGQLLLGRRASGRVPWNAAFRGGPVVVPDEGPLPTVTLGEGGRVTITLLSPSPAKLARMAPVWDRELGRVRAEEPTPEGAKVDRAGEAIDLSDLDALAARRSVLDAAPANGSSIAFLLEAAGVRCLFGADGHPDTLAAAIRRLNAERGVDRLPLDAFKLPHHGSEANVSIELLQLVDCRRYLVSTNGAYFNHPDPAAIARVIVAGGEAPEVHFNYHSPRSAMWDDPAHVGGGRHPYTPVYPTEVAGGLTVQLAAAAVPVGAGRR